MVENSGPLRPDPNAPTDVSGSARKSAGTYSSGYEKGYRSGYGNGITKAM